ncbi:MULTISPECIES: SMP-30/gluconolactonase/LRE family protein [unclassified Novosphingobium]|uniref:SMP-30/gluconolactonase/LRE family protein n=1 Tax=unclassified Novosphingobium TaxID=2644732 RepID=UPI00135A4D88|nr:MULTISPECIES: SMP-30/gluconolactonase/LRE family protein [unclassified Novosphingobium]
MTTVRIIERDRVDMLGEGLFWSAADSALLWTDIIGQRINRLYPATGRVESWGAGGAAGWIIGRTSGGFMAGIGRSITRVTLDPPTFVAVAEIPGEPETNRVNDAVADTQGRLWLGTMPFSCDEPVGSFYRFEKGALTRAAPDAYTIPNGPAIDPEGRFVLHTDSALGVIFRYPLEDGVLGMREPFITFEDGWGSPDGMTFDAEGYLWVACWGASCVTRFAPDGTVDRRIALPATQITNCTFGGEGLDRLYVTSAANGVDEELGGALFELDPGCKGLPPCLYRD